MLRSRDRRYESLPARYRTWDPGKLEARAAELKAKADELTREYIATERAIENLPARKRHPQPTAPLAVGSGGVTQQEPPPERRRGWLRRLFNRQ